MVVGGVAQRRDAMREPGLVLAFEVVVPFEGLYAICSYLVTFARVNEL